MGALESNRSDGREGFFRWLPYLAFAVAPFVVFPREMLAAGLMSAGDDMFGFLPYLLHSAQKLLRLEPFWTSELWMGMPLLATPETATLYPLRLPLLLVPADFAYAAYLLFHYVLSQISAYWYARELGQSRVSATLVAVAFAFSGFMLGHRAHASFVVAGAWTPLFLWFVRRAIDGRGPPRAQLLGAALSFAAIWFAGAVQLGTYLISLTLLLHAIEAWRTRSWRPIAIASVALVSGLMVAMAQILPSLDYARELWVSSSARTEYARTTDASFHPLLFPTLALPISPMRKGELYSRAGALVLCAALTTYASLRSARAVVQAWAVVAVVAFVLMAGHFVPPVARALHALPIVGILRGPVRHNYELGLALAVLAGFGLDAVLGAGRAALRTKLLRTAMAIAVFTALSVLALWILAHVAHDDRTRGMLLAIERQAPIRLGLFALAGAAAWLGVRALAPHARAAAGALAVMTVLLEARMAQAYDARHFHEVAARKIPRSFDFGADGSPTRKAPVRLLPPEIDDVRTLSGNAVLYIDGAQHLYGYTSIAPREAAEVLDLDEQGIPRSWDELARSRLPSVFAVTHLVMPESTCAGDACRERSYERVRHVAQNHFLYRNLDALPRVFTVSNLIEARSVAEARAILREDPSFDPKRSAIVEAPPAGPVVDGRVERAVFGGQRVDVWVDASQGPTFVVINDRFARNWAASVSGAPVPIHRANGLARGVLVPQGRHHIAMQYRVPMSVVFGFAVAALGLVSIVAAGHLLLRVRRSRL